MIRASQVLHLKPARAPQNPEESFLRNVRRDLERGLLRDVHGRRLVLMDPDDAARRLKERGTADA